MHHAEKLHERVVISALSHCFIFLLKKRKENCTLDKDPAFVLDHTSDTLYALISRKVVNLTPFCAYFPVGTSLVCPFPPNL
jgi:hypothetical protein